MSTPALRGGGTLAQVTDGSGRGAPGAAATAVTAATAVPAIPAVTAVAAVTAATVGTDESGSTPLNSVSLGRKSGPAPRGGDPVTMVQLLGQTSEPTTALGSLRGQTMKPREAVVKLLGQTSESSLGVAHPATSEAEAGAREGVPRWALTRTDTRDPCGTRSSSGGGARESGG